MTAGVLHAGKHTSAHQVHLGLTRPLSPQIIRLELIEHNAGADDANKTKESLNVLKGPLPNEYTTTAVHAFAGGRKTPTGLETGCSWE